MKTKYAMLTEKEWSAIEPLLPQKHEGAGRPRCNQRAVFEAGLWMLWHCESERALNKIDPNMASTVSRALWQWAENGLLEPAWCCFIVRTAPRGMVPQGPEGRGWRYSSEIPAHGDANGRLPGPDRGQCGCVAGCRETEAEGMEAAVKRIMREVLATAR
jgi:transposase